MKRDEIMSRLVAIANARTEDFGELVKISGLDAQKDFIYADLLGIDFRSTDLTPFNLHGCLISRGSLPLGFSASNLQLLDVPFTPDLPDHPATEGLAAEPDTTSEQARFVAALDIGTTSARCIIARVTEGGAIAVAGVGTTDYGQFGWKSGSAHPAIAGKAVMASIAKAEKMAAERIRTVVVNVGGTSLLSEIVNVEVAMNGNLITEADTRRMLDHGRAHHQRLDLKLLHTIPAEYAVDGTEGIKDPRGMYGNALNLAIHFVSASAGAVRQLEATLAECGGREAARVADPYASGLGCLVEDEKEVGVTCIDMGGTTTSMAVFLAGQLVHTEVIPVGGHHVTNDIGRGLSTPLHYAERMKILYGRAIPSPTDDREMLKVPLVGEDEDGASHQVPRSMLIQIIQPRLEETFELVRSRLEQGGFDKLAGRRVVLTGGASQVQGILDLAGLVLDKQVRLGRPVGLQGLPEATGGPAFSTCSGLIRYAMGAGFDETGVLFSPVSAPQSKLAQAASWFRSALRR